MNIIVVSPNYLNGLRVESESYRFNLQGYGNFKDAIEGLTKTNVSDIYGFALVLDRLPDKSAAMEKFIYQCNLICGDTDIRRRFVFCLKEDNLGNALGRGRYKNLDFYLSKFDVMNDLTIRRDVYGTILEGFHNPYAPPVTKPLVISTSLRGISYSRLLPSSLDYVLQDVDIRPTLDDTLEYDPYLSLLKRDSSLAYKLRIFGIRRMFDDSLFSDEEINYALDSINDSNKEMFSLIYSYIIERGLTNAAEFIQSKSTG